MNAKDPFFREGWELFHEGEELPEALDIATDYGHGLWLGWHAAKQHMELKLGGAPAL